MAVATYLTLFILIIIQNIYCNAAKVRRVGPYKATPVIARTYCNTTIVPLTKDAPVFFIKLYKRSNTVYLKGNATVNRDYPNVKLAVEQYFFENGQWKLTYRIPGVGCHREIVKILVTVTRMPFRYETCSMLKGSFKYEKIPVDNILHKWVYEYEPGLVMMRVSAITPKYTVGCFEIELNITRKLKN